MDKIIDVTLNMKEELAKGKPHLSESNITVDRERFSSSNNEPEGKSLAVHWM